MKKKCPACGHLNIVGADFCSKCFEPFTHQEAHKPAKEQLQKIIMTVPCGNFIAKIPPILVREWDTARQVVDQLQAIPTKGCVIVCDENDKMVGIVSIRDILLKVAGVFEDPAECQIWRIMTRNPEYVTKDSPLAYALHKMSIGKFRHVPILDKGVPVGVVSMRDIVSYLSTGEMPHKSKKPSKKK
jgi:signal-transduction protein with cAMP-binding, CBS, and nucleotidyltransferase domain